MSKQHCALVMAGGTGGHIFPGLAVAEALRERGWRVHWLGGRGSEQRPSMESQLVPPRGFPFESIDFSGVRGKGPATLVFLPLRLLKAFWQSIQVVRRVKPDVVVGLGGYISFPAGMMSVLLGKPLVLHEQNSVAGMVNKVLAGVADRVFTAFPNVFRKAEWVGNPLRPAFIRQPGPVERFAGRTGPLKLLVVGGSLGARGLNELVPKALALIPEGERPQVIHQSGAHQIDELRANYAATGVQAELTPFIEDTAQAFADADLIICRSGASTVTEIAAVGARGAVRAFSRGGRRPPDHQREVSGGPGRRLAYPAARPDA
jgi:UDP-N-acetylglucosamine--N-acetylmuramyl-(pentapeptide) pyrophosphoryl-undecaprenol N-acetylglucosamine transferase